jgi:hypothetical protein
MNIEHIKEARAEVAALLESFDQIISFHETMIAAVAGLVGMPVKEAEPVTVQNPRQEKPQAKPTGPKRGRPAGGGQELQQIREWMEKRAEPFSFEDLPETLKASRSKTAKAIGNLVTRGKLKRVSHGVYQRIAEGAEREAVEETSDEPEPETVPEPAKSVVGLKAKHPAERVAEAARHIIGLHGGKSLSARILFDEAKGLFPELTMGSNAETNFRVRLIDAACNGMLTRLGKGPDAVYTTTPKGD